MSSSLTPAIASALDVMRDLSAALLSSPNGSNARVHALVHEAQAALRLIEDAGAAAPGAVTIDLLDHLSHHRSSVMDSTNPRLYVQQLVGSVLHGAGVARARRAALITVGDMVRGRVHSSPCTAMLDDSSASSSTVDDVAEASLRGLAGVYSELFDERSGAPVALAQVDESMQAQFLPSATLAALRAVPSDVHTRLIDALQTPLLGLPWTPLPQHELDAFFSPFTPSAEAKIHPKSVADTSATPSVTPLAPPAWTAVLATEAVKFQEYERIMPSDYVREVCALGSVTFHATGLARLLDRFTTLRWATCPVGTPFVFCITRENAASVGVPNYFDVITEPMDLARMRARLEAGAGGEGYAVGAAGVESLFADASKMIRNAKVFHGPKEARKADPTFPDPAALGAKFSSAKGNIYGMAFDLEQLVTASRAHAHAALAAVQRAGLRKTYRDAELAPFNDAAFWVRLVEAAKLQALDGGYSDLIDEANLYI